MVVIQCDSDLEYTFLHKATAHAAQFEVLCLGSVLYILIVRIEQEGKTPCALLACGDFGK